MKARFIYGPLHNFVLDPAWPTERYTAAVVILSAQTGGHPAVGHALPPPKAPAEMRRVVYELVRMDNEMCEYRLVEGKAT